MKKSNDRKFSTNGFRLDKRRETEGGGLTAACFISISTREHSMVNLE